MNTERWHLIEHLFHAARELPRGERGAFLARTCAGDAELGEELISLLRESDEAEDFLAEPAISTGVHLLARKHDA